MLFHEVLLVRWIPWVPYFVLQFFGQPMATTVPYVAVALFALFVHFFSVDALANQFVRTTIPSTTDIISSCLVLVSL
jgi:hypothetical protein